MHCEFWAETVTPVFFLMRNGILMDLQEDVIESIYSRKPFPQSSYQSLVSE